MEGASGGNTLYGIFYFIFMSAVIIGAAYLVTRLIAKRSIASGGNKNLKVVETLSLGLDKSLMLIKAGEQYLLLGSTPKGITFLSEIKPEKLNNKNESEFYSDTKEESFEAYLKNFNHDKNNSVSNRSIKNNLKKLKSIVRGNRSDD